MSKPDTPSRVNDLLSAFLGALGLGLLVSTHWEIDTSVPYPFYKGPLIFPLIVLCLMVLASLPAAWRMIHPSQDASWTVDGRGAPVKPGVLVGMMMFFVLGLWALGLEASSFLFTGAALYYLGLRSPWRCIGIPLLCALVLSLLFKHALGIYFPKPWLFELFFGN
jgi:hypothetical protein